MKPNFEEMSTQELRPIEENIRIVEQAIAQHIKR